MRDNQGVTMKRWCRFRVTSFPTNHRDFIESKTADKPDNIFLKDPTTSSIKEVDSKCKSFKSTEIKEQIFLASPLDDSFYFLKAISGNGEKFKVHFLTEDITKENLDLWKRSNKQHLSQV